MLEATTVKDRMDLTGFTGTGQYYKSNWFVLHTEGIEYLAETAGAYWLIDAIGSYQAQWKNKAPFQIWTLRKDTAKHEYGAVLTMKEDSDQPEKIRQYIEFTDFPFEAFDGEEFKCYCINDGGGLPTVLLPSEY